MKKDRRKIGKQNQRRGKTFEQLCVKYANKVAPSLNVEWVKKERFTSAVDIQFHDFPHLKVDCKRNIGMFSFLMKKRLYKETKLCYTESKRDETILIFGECFGKQKVNMSEVSVFFREKNTGMLVSVNYRQFLLYLVRLKESKKCLVKQRQKNRL